MSPYLVAAKGRAVALWLAATLLRAAQRAIPRLRFGLVSQSILRFICQRIC
jgi:hypothetical protein